MRARLRRSPVVVDVAASTAVLVVDLLFGPRLTGNPVPSVPELVLTALTLAAVPLRHRRPVPALALTVAGAAAVLLQGSQTVAVLAPVVALYTVALRSDRRTTVLAWAWTAVVLALATALGASGLVPWQDGFQVLPWTAVVAAVGDALRNRRAYLAAVEERAARAERTREEEARRRVAEERMRIARELHDVVAHHIAVVSVQAGVAEHLVTTQPTAAVDALGLVRRSAATILEELGDILSVLREPGQLAESTAPAPGLARLDALFESFTAAGLVVDWSLHGRPRQLAPAVDLVAYRVLEEGLTNALKYGTGTAQVSLDYRPSSLLLRVVNSTGRAGEAYLRSRFRSRGDDEVAAGTTNGTGHGLLGMRERAAAVGGTLRATPTSEDVFCVEADLPLRAGARTGGPS